MARAAAVPSVPPVPSPDNPEARLDRMGEQNVGGTPVGVPEDAWDLVLKRLGHMQSQAGCALLKEKTLASLWETHGASTS